jgi:hypothetical protein
MISFKKIRQFRKTTLILLTLFLVFLFQVSFKGLSRHQGDSAIDAMQLTTLNNNSFVICRNIVNGEPFGLDSIFYANQNRVYFYSELPPDSSGEINHVWFRELDTILKSNCPATESKCISSIMPGLLDSGLWSVDIVKGKKLIASKQFYVQ